jgi:hypothetical protein
MLMVRLILAVVASGVAGTLANSVIVAGPDAERVHPARPSAPAGTRSRSRSQRCCPPSMRGPPVPQPRSLVAAPPSGLRFPTSPKPHPFRPKRSKRIGAPAGASAAAAETPASTLKNRHTLGEGQPGGDRLEEVNRAGRLGAKRSRDAHGRQRHGQPAGDPVGAPALHHDLLGFTRLHSSERATVCSNVTVGVTGRSRQRKERPMSL